MRSLILSPLILAISLLFLSDECTCCFDIDGYVSSDEVSETVIKMVGVPNQSGRDILQIQIDRCVLITGNNPFFLKKYNVHS